jgi:protein SCO1/2
MHFKNPANRLAGLLIVTATVMGIALAQIEVKPTTENTVEWLQEPRQLADFSLSGKIQTFSNENLKNGWHLLLFGYTQCPDICPTMLAELAPLINKLANHNIQLVFISVDPERDSMAALSDYVGYFHPDFIAATGSDEQLQPLVESLGVRYQVSKTPSSYNVSHSVTLSVVDPQGRLQGRLRSGFDLQATAAEIDWHLRDES